MLMTLRPAWVGLAATAWLVAASATSPIQAAPHRHREHPQSARPAAQTNFNRLLTLPGADLPVAFRWQGDPSHALTRSQFNAELSNVQARLRLDVSARAVERNREIHAIWVMQHAGHLDYATALADQRALQASAVADIGSIRAEIALAQQLVQALAANPQVGQVALLGPPSGTHPLPVIEGLPAGSPSK